MLLIEYAVFYKAEQLRSNPTAARNYFNSINKFAYRVKIKEAVAPDVRDVLAKGSTMERYMQIAWNLPRMPCCVAPVRYSFFSFFFLLVCVPNVKFIFFVLTISMSKKHYFLGP